jgi:hypothetical protein
VRQEASGKMQEARPAIQLHIDHLILDGLPIERTQVPAVQAAVEAELSRLLTERGMGSEWQAGGAVPSVRASAIQISSNHNATQLGRQIAQSVYSGMGHIR